MLTRLLLLLQLASSGVESALAQPAQRVREADARGAQRHFEMVRRMQMPRVWRVGTAACDVHVGRMCYWHDPNAPEPPPEPDVITRARLELLDVLAEALRSAPDSQWILGQLTRYRLEAGQHDGALAGLAACTGARWWCHAFKGLVLHELARYREADSVYADALAAMDATRRCHWLDTDPLLGVSVPCAERPQLMRQTWLLGQPFWHTGVRDFRTEYLSRLTMSALMEDAANPHGLEWGDDNREVLLRYGWARAYSRQVSSASPYEPEPIRGHDREPNLAVLPVAPVTDTGMPALRADDWDPDDRQARARYAPAYLEALVTLPHVTTRLPRGDSLLVVVAHAVDDTLLARDSLDVHLVAFDGAGFSTGSASPHLSTAAIANRRHLISAEVVRMESRRAARARFSVEPLDCAATCVSDLLLYQRDSAAASLAQALAGALPVTRVTASRPLGVYWETAGLPRGARGRVSLKVEPAQGGFVRRLVSRLGLGRRVASTHMQWRFASRDALDGTGVLIAIPASARGEHVVTLTIELSGADSPPLVARRAITLVP